MPVTGLTSTVNPDESFLLFDITINAGILGKNASEWLTEKERTCFDTTGSPLRVSVDAGTKLDALVYVLLHEATHVVDFCELITPPVSEESGSWRADNRPASPFTEGVWSDLDRPAPAFCDPLRARVGFYGFGRAIPVDQAFPVYASLRRTPFVSLYGGRNSRDDLAEFVTVYHVTEILRQPYRTVIRYDNDEVFAFEPMKSEIVRRRIALLKRFYEGG